MSMPPLPETFGNYALKGFAEIVALDPINWWPQTLAWKCLACLLILVISIFLWRRLKLWYHNRYRRAACTRLLHIDQTSDDSSIIQAINQLLKITAIKAYSRQRVAQLSGNEWINFLNNRCEQTPFNDECIVLLTQNLYRQQPIGSVHRCELIAASQLWIQSHITVKANGANGD
jgi:hypothetical protein